MLGTICEDVRRAPPVDPPSDDRDHDRKKRHGHYDHESAADHALGDLFGAALLYGFTAPFLVPHTAVQDNMDYPCYFPGFPYDRTSGCLIDPSEPDPSSPLVSGPYQTSLLAGGTFAESPDGACGEGAGGIDTTSWPVQRTWSGRFSAEFAEEFGNLDVVSGRLMLGSTSRWGFDSQMDWLQERLPGGGHDRLWLGDCNVTFRFAQSPRTQWRAGLGFNWLDDPVQTDFGFNFTYGVDFFPVKPWILSSTLDWGTIGRAEQFRFQATAGIIVNRIEIYTGYEYLDIDRTQINSLLGGVRIWF